MADPLAHVRAAVVALLGVEALDARPIARGFAHDNVYARLADGREVVVKVPRDPRPAKTALMADMLRRLAAAGVPAPRLIVHDVAAERSPVPCVILSWQPGDALVDVVATLDAGELAAAGAALGGAIAALHAVTHPDVPLAGELRAELDRRLARARATGLVPAAWLGRAAALVERAIAEADAGALPAATIHGDLYLDNVIVGGMPGRRELAGLIDFDHCEPQDAARDFVKLRWWVFERYPALAEPVVAGYLTTGGDPAAADPASARFRAAATLETLAGIPYFTLRAGPGDDRQAADFRRRLAGLVGAGL